MLSCVNLFQISECHFILVLFILTLQTACRSHFIVLKSCSFCVDFTVAHHNISNATACSFLPYNSSHIYSILSIVLRANCPTFCCTTTAFSRSSSRCARVDTGNTSLRSWIRSTWSYLIKQEESDNFRKEGFDLNDLYIVIKVLLLVHAFSGYAS